MCFSLLDACVDYTSMCVCFVYNNIICVIGAPGRASRGAYLLEFKCAFIGGNGHCIWDGEVKAGLLLMFSNWERQRRSKR